MKHEMSSSIPKSKLTLPTAGRDHIQGPIDAPIVPVEYGDYESRIAVRHIRLILRPPQRIFYGENFSTTDNRHTAVDDHPGQIRLNNGSAGKSGRRKLCVADWDGDGRLDVLANSANANFCARPTRAQETFSFATWERWHNKTSKVMT